MWRGGVTRSRKKRAEHRAGSSDPCLGLGSQVRSRPAGRSRVRSRAGVLGAGSPQKSAGWKEPHDQNPGGDSGAQSKTGGRGGLYREAAGGLRGTDPGRSPLTPGSLGGTTLLS